MAILRMKGEKTKALCCLPLGVAALIIAVVLVCSMFGTSSSLISNARTDHDKLDWADYLNLVFQLLPFVCAILVFPGIILRSAKLLKYGYLAVYPSMTSVVISVLMLWVAFFTRSHDKENSELEVDGIDIGVKDSETVALIQVALLTLWHILQLVVLCYVGDILKSASNQAAKGRSLWKVHQ